MLRASLLMLVLALIACASAPRTSPPPNSHRVDMTRTASVVVEPATISTFGPVLEARPRRDHFDLGPVLGNRAPLAFESAGYLATERAWLGADGFFVVSRESRIDGSRRNFGSPRATGGGRAAVVYSALAVLSVLSRTPDRVEGDTLLHAFRYADEERPAVPLDELPSRMPSIAKVALREAKTLQQQLDILLVMLEDERLEPKAYERARRSLLDAGTKLILNRRPGPARPPD